MNEHTFALLGQRLRHGRKKGKMTQEQLAEQAGCSAAHISHIENGSTIPSLYLVIKIAQILSITSDALLCDYLSGSGTSSRESDNILQNCTAREKDFLVETLRSFRKHQ